MIGLLALTALPTTIAVAEGISSQKRAAAAAAQPADEKLMRKFQLRCYCAAKSPLRSAVHGGVAVVRDGKVYIFPPSRSPSASPTPPRDHPIEAFYIHYPDPALPPPPPLGLVTTVPTSPPTLNWLYVHARTGELRYGNRTQSRAHTVGPWGWVVDEDGGEGGAFADEDAEGGGGGLTLGGRERFVVVEPVGEGEGGWEVRWDERDDGLKGGEGVAGRRVLRVSLEREFVEGREVEGGEGKEGAKSEGKVEESIGKKGVGEEGPKKGVKKEEKEEKGAAKRVEKKTEKEGEKKDEKGAEKKTQKQGEKKVEKGAEKKDEKEGKKQEEKGPQKGKKLEIRPKKEVEKKEGAKKGQAEAVKIEKPKKGQK